MRVREWPVEADIGAPQAGEPDPKIEGIPLHAGGGDCARRPALLRLANYQRHEGVSEISTIKLAAFDVDGTILRGENICGCLARKLGRSAEMDAFELLCSRDEIAAGRRTMLEWYTPFDQAALIDHLSELRLAPGVRKGFARLKEAGVKIALVSITWEFAVSWLASELGADYAVGTGRKDDGDIVHFWPEDKASYLKSLIAELKIDQDSLAAVGDSLGDIAMLNFAARSYFVGEHMPPKLSHAKHWHDADIERIVSDMLA